MVKFTGKIWKQGSSHVLTIPADFIKHEILEVDKEYEVYIATKGKTNEIQNPPKPS